MSDESSERPTPDAVWFRQNVELVEFDLLAVLRKHRPAVGDQVIVHCLIELTGTLIAAKAREGATERAAVERQLADMLLFVTSTEGPSQ